MMELLIIVPSNSFDLIRSVVAVAVAVYCHILRYQIVIGIVRIMIVIAIDQPLS